LLSFALLLSIEEFAMAATQKRVLVVDDALDIARLLRSALGAADPDLVINVFPSAEEAIFASAREPVHLLISDIRLPGISGADLVRRIRASNPGVKVILITGLNKEQSDIHVHGLSVDGFFQKPFEVSEFVDLAQRCLLEALVVTPEKLKIPAAAPVAVPFASEERLAEIKSSVNAQSAWLFDRNGAYLTGAGAIPAAGRATQWGLAAAAALANQTAVDSLLEAKPYQRILTLRGGSQDLILASVDGHILALFMPGSSSVLRLALAVEEILHRLPSIADVIPQLPVVTAVTRPLVPPPDLAPVVEEHTVPVVPAAAEGLHQEPEIFTDLEIAAQQDTGLSDLASLLQGEAAITGEDADAFWESLVDTTTSPTASETISFEEAMRLGLTSDKNGPPHESLRQ
jgi:CheY-like chemotaxis protein